LGHDTTRNTGTRKFSHRKKGIFSGIVLLGVIVAGLSLTPGSFGVRRSASEAETVFYYFAQNLGAESLCDRISWNAYTRYSVLFGGGGASYFRSDCHERVAEARHDAYHCWSVRPLLDFDPESSGYSALSCRRRTQANYHSGIAIPDPLLIQTFKRMGYDIDAMPVEGISDPPIRLFDVYGGVVQDVAAVKQIQQLLTSTGEALTVDDRRYLAQLAAIATGDAHWCESIPIALAATDTAAPSRDRCYLEVANNTDDVRLCERMTPAALEPEVQAAQRNGVRGAIAEQMGQQGECLRIAQRVGSAAHYGPTLPTNAEQTRRMLAALHVAVPLASDWSVERQADYFIGFLGALWPTTEPDAVREKIRMQLVARLLALPVSP
jgi:hypothetical protein